jgi:hypothetical protein
MRAAATLLGAISTMTAWGEAPWPLPPYNGTDTTLGRDMTLRRSDGTPIGRVEVGPGGKRTLLSPSGTILDQIVVDPRAVPPWRSVKRSRRERQLR